MAEKRYVIGVDYGTDSVRSVIVDADTGREAGSAVFAYPRWKKGLYCDPAKNQFRQHPLDYLEGLENTVKGALEKAGKSVAANVAALTIDTTGSTPIALDKSGTPLCLTRGFENNPNAMFVLWKDHTSVQEADDINRIAKSWGGIDYTRFSGGVYSSEWFWAKMLHILRHDAKVRANAWSWAEHCDWLPALLAGNIAPLTMPRSRCAAGHKAMWHASFDGLPSEAFLVKLDKRLKGLRSRLYTETVTADKPVGTLTREWAARLGLTTRVVVGAGAFDAHMGAVGAEITPFALCKVIGTSTCDMLIAPMARFGKKRVAGICGQVDGSIVPGMLGMEAGQSAFGDIYAWFRDLIVKPSAELIRHSPLLAVLQKDALAEELEEEMISHLTQSAEKLPAGESGVVAVDWMNGRRTPNANQALRGAIAGLNLGSDAPRLFRALVEATAFGSRKIADCFTDQGVPIKSVIAIGGVAKKSPFVMQTLADVLNRPIQVAHADQACALGAAMCASVAGNLHSSVPAAQKAMGSGFEKTYSPKAKNVAVYNALYRRYAGLGHYLESQTQ